jgi:hypothetical protein
LFLDDCIDYIPLGFRFYRPVSAQTTILQDSKFLGKGMMTSLLKPFTGKLPRPFASMTNEEKAAKREAMRSAAEERSTAWGKKVSAKSAARKADSEPSSVISDESVTKEETARAIRLAKEGEVQLEQQLGYNPLRPHMSFSGNPNTISTSTIALRPAPLTPTTSIQSVIPVVEPSPEESGKFLFFE